MVLERRVVSAVYGNVRITMTAELAGTRSARASRSAVELQHHRYLVRFAFYGFYPPSRTSCASWSTVRD